jgi:hypothetical protein
LCTRLLHKCPAANITTLLDHATPPDRSCYPAQTAEDEWSRTVIEDQIMNQLRRRFGAEP